VTDFVALAGLALSAFLSATILPMASEGVLLTLSVTEAAPGALLLAVAASANTAGACVNWVLGRFVSRFRDKKWFPASPIALRRAEHWYRTYGWPSLLLSWVPIVGDPLTVVAGLLRTPLWLFVLVVGFAKTARYAALLGLMSL
jgi:membrane protein YqaA with SNARE-associated domain